MVSKRQGKGEGEEDNSPLHERRTQRRAMPKRTMLFILAFGFPVAGVGTGGDKEGEDDRGRGHRDDD